MCIGSSGPSVKIPKFEAVKQPQPRPTNMNFNFDDMNRAAMATSVYNPYAASQAAQRKSLIGV